MSVTPPRTPPRFAARPPKTSAPEATEGLSSLRLSDLGDPGTSWLNLQEDGEALADEAGIPTMPGDYPAVPGYAILGELGRGGMGVVYRADQKSLHRPVALKMILRGDYASPEERVRFLVEAEMLARVKHPNIVQVYEVGTHNGYPFLSLELVEGGTLQDFTDGAPQPPRQAAALLAILADAVQAAHSQGVVHRDLKPSNILLHRLQENSDGSQELPTHLRSKHPVYGIPKITDFGLAKRFDDDSRLTTTGHVLGTPSYMAPEQAQGRRDVGPGADTYALGAILYELLTGTPPFRGSNSIETLNKVIHEDPPTLDARTVPADLAVICFKCLEKDPARRYRSAAHLGEDLARFLRDEPITARPISRRERLARWCRRHPDTAALALGCMLATLLGFVGILWKWGEAIAERRAADEARQSAEALLEEVTFKFADKQLDEAIELALARQPSAPTEELLAMHRFRAALLARTLTRHQEAVRRKPGDPEPEFSLLRTYRRLCEAILTLRLSPLPVSLPPDLEKVDLEEVFSATESRFAALAAARPDRADILHEHAMARRWWAYWLIRKPLAQPSDRLRAERLLLDAIALETEAIRLSPARDLRRWLAMLHSDLTETRGMLDRPVAERLEPLLRFVAIRENLAADPEADRKDRRELGGAYKQLQRFLYLVGDCEGSLAAAAKAQPILERLLQESPSPGAPSSDLERSAMVRYFLFQVHETRAKCLEHLGAADAALASYREAGELAFPQVLPRLLSQQAYCAAHAGHVSDAERLADDLLRLRPLSDEWRFNAFCVLASCWQSGGDEEAAERCAEKAAALVLDLEERGKLQWPKPGIPSADVRAPSAAEELMCSGLRHHPRFLELRRRLDRAASGN